MPIGFVIAAVISLALYFSFGRVWHLRDGFAPASILLCFATTVLGQPLIEEFYFRGVLFVALSRRFGQFATVGLTSIAFALFHVGGYRLILVFLGWQ